MKDIMLNQKPLSTEEFLNRMTQSSPVPQAQNTQQSPSLKPISADEFSSRYASQQVVAPQVQADQAPSIDTPRDFRIPTWEATGREGMVEGAFKTAVNVIPSALNFGIDAVRETVKIPKNIYDIATKEIPGLVQEAGGAKQAARMFMQELPGTGAEVAKGIIPAVGQGIDTGIEGARKSIIENPFGNIAPFIFGAKQGARTIDQATQARAQAAMGDYVRNMTPETAGNIPRGTGTNLGGAIDTAIEKTGQLVTKPVAGAVNAVGEGISGGIKSGIGQVIGVGGKNDTVGEIIKNPQLYTKEKMKALDREGLGKELQDIVNKKSELMDETSGEYEVFRRSPTPVVVDRNWLDDTIKETTGLEVKKGKLTTSGTASIRDRQDVNALQTKYDLWKPIFSRGSMTADEYLNFRTDMAGLAKLGREVSKSGPLENLSGIIRGKFNTEYRKQIKGLEEKDADLSSQKKEWRELTHGLIDREGNLTDAALGRVANLSKDKPRLYAQLEELSPGISQKVKTMQVIKDIESASGIKVGTYTKGALLGGGLVLGGIPQALITAILTSPSVAVPLLRQYGLLKNAKAVNAVVQALRDSATKVNALPVTLDKDVRDVKVKAGLSIEDVSGGKPTFDKFGTPIVKGEGNSLPSLADPADNGGVWYHGTTAENKASILKNGINTQLNKKGYAEQPEAFYMADKKEAGMYGGDSNAVGIRVKKGEMVKTLNVASPEWAETLGRSSGTAQTAEALRKLRAKGYDAINHGDEIEVLNPNKFEVFDPQTPKTTLGKKSSPVVGETTGSLETQAKGKSLEEFVKAQGETLYHGTQAPDFDQFSGINYFTKDAKEAAGFAEGLHLVGKRGGTPRVIEGVYPMKKVKDVDDAISEALMDGDVDLEIANQIKIAQKEGYDTISFTHPSNYTDGEFTAYVPVDSSVVKTRSQLTDIWKKANAKSNLGRSTVYEGPKELTLKTLDKLKGRSTVSKQFISDLTNAGDIKQAERDVIRKILAEEGNNVNVSEFIGKVESQLLPLKRSGGSGYVEAKAEREKLFDRQEASGLNIEDYLKKNPAEKTKLEELNKTMRDENPGAFGGESYENIVLPDDLRGPVASYSEHIYQSPIKTSAGNVHFSKEDAGGYFAHTRVEDMSGSANPKAKKMLSGPNQGIRRVIEIQSDLFQKGRLESETGQFGVLKGDESRASIGEVELAKRMKIRDAEIAKLEPYRNTWYERIIREEIKQAAKDGKTKLQFPTGETAMKIEGLGQQEGWTIKRFPKDYKAGGSFDIEKLTPEKLKVGERVWQGEQGQGRDWIITDVLGDGKFKAVPKNIYDKLARKELAGNDPYAETFDISGKVDTENPIYKFYEKDVQKFLNKLGGKKVVDDRGVEWIELDLSKEDPKKPVQAFGKAQVKTVLGGAAATGAGLYAFGARDTSEK